MGGAVSELRAEIHAHALLVRHYPTLLEPVLAAVQFFLRTAEAGEGADGERALEDPAMDLMIADKRRLLVDEASTEVELLAENPAVMQGLLLAVRDWRSLALSPGIDPHLRWYDPPWQRGERRNRPMPRTLEVPEDEVPRFRTAVLRTSVRCLRLLMLCADGREQLEATGGPELLNGAALDNPLDDFVQADVKAIFRAVYGGENAVRRIAISGVPTVVEMMRENTDSAIVQLAGVRRMCQLLAGAAEPPAVVVAAESPKRPDQQQPDTTTLFEELDTFGAVALAVETLTRFDVDQYLALYVHISRFIAYVAVKERNAKLAGQAGGVQGCIKLLFRARELQRDKKARDKADAARRAREEAQTPHEWSGILEESRDTTTTASATKVLAAPPAQPPPSPLAIDGQGNVTAAGGVAALAVVDFTPVEVAQQTIWALDLLAKLNFNVSMMKLHKLKYLLEEIRLDPDTKDIGDALIVTRRLRLIRWDDVSMPPGASSPKQTQHTRGV